MNMNKSLTTLLAFGITFSTALPAQSADTSYKLKDYLGSLYNEFPWSGPLRDPSRKDVEIHSAFDFNVLSTDAASTLAEDMESRDIIMQIGGMGSAKKNHDNPGQVNPQFADYMDSFIADNGISWTQQVTTRATEVAAVTPSSEKLTWQIGNEINAQSYSENIHYYFQDGKASHMSDTSTIPVYVEYFLAPSIQGIHNAEAATGKDIRIALGSIASAAAIHSQAFMNELLNYEITGTYAPELAGTKVFELIDTLTVHYFIGQGSTTTPEAWRDYLTTTRDTWIGKGNIKGIWSTEEIGVRAADSGFGAAMSFRIISRYLDWVNQNNYSDDESKWFFYGTGKGAETTRIENGMQDLYDLVGDNGLQFVSHELLDGNALEVYTYYVPAKQAYLITATNLSTGSLAIDSITTVLADTSVSSATVSGWYYNAKNKETLLTTNYAANGKMAVSLNLPSSITNTEAVVLWVVDSSEVTTPTEPTPTKPTKPNRKKNSVKSANTSSTAAVNTTTTAKNTTNKKSTGKANKGKKAKTKA